MNTPGKKALFDNLGDDAELTVAIDAAVRATASHGWRGHAMKERRVRRCLETSLPDKAAVEQILEILKNYSEY